VSAVFRNGVLEVRVPHWMPEAQRQQWVERMRARVERRRRRSSPTDAELEDRAQALNRRYFDGELSWTSIRWARQDSRWGSCTSTAATIRISDRLRGMPAWVLDSVIVHELAHLVHWDHGPGFWALANRYEDMAKANGFLAGVAFAEGRASEVD
jgi:predicted metal-dependent hydrolase